MSSNHKNITVIKIALNEISLFLRLRKYDPVKDKAFDSYSRLLLALEKAFAASCTCQTNMLEKTYLANIALGFLMERSKAE